MLGNASCFLLTLLVGVQFDIAGGISATELVLPIFGVFFVFVRKKTDFDKNFYVVLILGIFFLLGLILSDLWHDTPFEKYSRGWGRVIVFISNFVSLYVIIDNRRSRLLWLTFGFVVGRLWLSIDSIENGLIVWKLGLAKPLALVALLLCVTVPKLRAPGSLFSSLLILTLGLINILADFRSLGAVLVIVAALMILVHQGQSAKRYRGSLPVSAVAGMVIASFLAAAMSSWFYGYAADQGWLSPEATQKYESQASEAGLPLIIAGRSESLVSVEAVMDAPLLGHGSWPENPYYADRLAFRRYQLGLSKSMTPSEDTLIPTHSHLLGSWVEAGLAGGIFWSIVLFLAGKSMLLSCRSKSHMQALYLFCAVLLIWDVLFSPFSGFRRLETAFLLLVVLRALLQRSSMPSPFGAATDRSRRQRRQQHQRRHRSKRPKMPVPPSRGHVSFRS